jgi:hypothetical protein
MPPGDNVDRQPIIEISGTRLTTSEVAAVARDDFPVRLSQEPDIRILASKRELRAREQRTTEPSGSGAPL